MNDTQFDPTHLPQEIKQSLGGLVALVFAIWMLTLFFVIAAKGPDVGGKFVKKSLGIFGTILWECFRAVWNLGFSILGSFDRHVVNKKKKKPASP